MYGFNKYAYNFDIKLIPFEICLIYKPTFSFRFLTLDSSDSNHISKFTVVVDVAFTKKGVNHINKK